MPIIPTLFTMINGFLGFLSILYSVKFAVSGEIHSPLLLIKASWLIMLAILFDAFDGEVARSMNKTSEFGAELDSLCDAISFGVAPAVLLFTWMHISFRQIGFPALYSRALYLILSIYVLSAIARLARFNVETLPDKEYHLKFKGLPTPAAGGFLTSIVILQAGFINPDSYIYSLFGRFLMPNQITILNFIFFYTLPAIILITAYLMVSRITYPHALGTIMGEHPRIEYFIYLFTVFAILWIIRDISFFLFFLLYIVITPIFTRKKSNNKT